MLPFNLHYLRFRCLTLLIGGSTLLTGCGQGQADASAATAAEAPQALPVMRLVPRDTVLTREYVADIQAVRNVEVRARVKGYLEKIYVDEGQLVKKGQPLFRISDAEYRTRLARLHAARSNATAQARVASLELDRVRMLTEKNVISKTELDVAQAKLRAAEASVAEARSAETNAALMLSYTLVRAPFDGTVNREPMKVGSLVDDGTLLTTVSDARAVFAYFNVSEAEYLEFIKTRAQDSARSTNQARLLLADGSRYAPPGKIETVESQFQASTGAIAFRARFPNPKGLLKHGATGKVSLANTVADALMVPQKAVFEQQDKNYVYVVDEQGTVHQKNFVPRSRLAAFYVVKSGLQPGERIVCEGTQDLRDGARITPRPVTLRSMLAGPTLNP
ncbi:efflux RND transporter periplasmic adaptor subunit [Hymenobacter sp. BT683]|uniref:Efflux RND transporter periplasmic adaptor subunit n=1 Tax=Hymenobacter jeongseonensis TaxID=2791027 RepID=A0ABS0IM31_9BACT|nr:efflux RND transporter periplasmic adaptor subunit [Hymenobacter jeongseonensis]MBF9239433.1 efflux RND transporter periplasmic adaptor subunit [Hymenobacter jeongseonensis]